MPKIGDIVRGKVKKVKQNHKGFDCGASVELEKGGRAYLPIREISEKFVKRVSDEVQEGEERDFRIIGENKKFKEWTVSLNQADSSSYEEQQERKKNERFNKQLENFMKDSREKISQIQNNNDRKRGVKNRK